MYAYFFKMMNTLTRLLYLKSGVARQTWVCWFLCNE